jgi:hypothetical protein
VRVIGASFLASGVTLGAGARWIQLGRTLVSAGQAGHDLDFSLSTSPPPSSRPCSR